jgi:hypothetical protein
LDSPETACLELFKDLTSTFSDTVSSLSSVVARFSFLKLLSFICVLVCVLALVELIPANITVQRSINAIKKGFLILPPPLYLLIQSSCFMHK